MLGLNMLGLKKLGLNLLGFKIVATDDGITFVYLSLWTIKNAANAKKTNLIDKIVREFCWVIAT
jgi:hypothetical protein